MCVKAVVSQQSHKFDDLIDMLVVVSLVGNKDLPCVEEQQIGSECQKQSVI